MKILVVEDEPASLKLANLVLSDSGHEVTEAYSAEEALKTVHDNCPDIILLDLALPGIDGLSLAKQLKEDSRTRGIPIVAVTAYPERFPKEGVLRARCDAYITKPINTRTLAHQVSGLSNLPDRGPQPGRSD